jgi:hypothetical protein
MVCARVVITSVIGKVWSELAIVELIRDLQHRVFCPEKEAFLFAVVPAGEQLMSIR